MKLTRTIALSAFALSFPAFLNSCVETQKEPTGPQSSASKLPWNTPVAGQGQGQFGMLPQSQYRR